MEKIEMRVWRIAGVVIIGSFMTTLGSSLVNVGLDTIARDLRVRLVDVQWVTSGYLVAFAAVLPLTAWLSRRAGAGRVWLGALAGFTVSSALCTLAPNLALLVVLRVLQGAAGAMLVPAGQTVIGLVAGPGRMGRVLNSTKIVVVLAPAVGPALGGLLVSGLSWRWLFLVNVPVGAAALLFGARIVPRGERAPGGAFDPLGFALVAAGLPLVVYGVTAVGRYGGLAAETATLPAGLVLLGLFAARSRTVPRPLLDLRLFANRTYAAAVALVFFAGAALLGTMILLPLYYQLLRHESVLHAGLLMFAVGAGAAASMPFGGPLTDRIGGGIVSVAGLALSTAGVVPFVFLDAGTNLAVVAALQAVTGFGLGIAAMPALSVAYATVPADRLPDATSEANIVQRVGGSTGSALLIVILGRHGAPTAAAFHAAFACLAAATVAALGLACWLTAEERRLRPAASSRGRRAVPSR